MGKPTIYIGENKDADQLRGNASSSFLCLYRPVCVGPVWKPHCWFSHETAQILNILFITIDKGGCADTMSLFQGKPILVGRQTRMEQE